MQTLPPPTKDKDAIMTHPLKIVALGDSLVYGYGDPVGGGWAERLRRLWMESAGHTLYNLGIRGDRVVQVSERLEQEFRLRGEIRNRLPDLILLSVGVNDTARLGRPDGRTYTDHDLFQTQIEHHVGDNRTCATTNGLRNCIQSCVFPTSLTQQRAHNSNDWVKRCSRHWGKNEIVRCGTICSK